MKTQSLLFLAGAALAVPFSTHAGLTLEAEAAFVSKYVFRGLQQSRAAVQPHVRADFENLYLGIWSSIPVRDSNELSELDAYVGWRQDLTDRTSLDLGATHYWYWNTGPGGTRRAQEIFSTLGHRFLEDDRNLVMGKGTLFYDIRRKAFTLETALSYAYSLAPAHDLPLTLAFAAYFGTSQAKDLFPDSGTRIKESYIYTGFSADSIYDVTEATHLRLGVAYGDVGNYLRGTQHLQQNWWVRASVQVAF